MWFVMKDGIREEKNDSTNTELKGSSRKIETLRNHRLTPVENGFSPFAIQSYD